MYYLFSYLVRSFMSVIDNLEKLDEKKVKIKKWCNSIQGGTCTYELNIYIIHAIANPVVLLVCQQYLLTATYFSILT